MSERTSDVEAQDKARLLSGRSQAESEPRHKWLQREHPLLHLQRTRGNRYVQKILQCQTTEKAPPITRRAPIMRSPQGIPGGANMETTNADTDTVLSLLEQAARASSSVAGGNVDFRSNVGHLIDADIANNLPQPTISFDFVETRGLNVRWRGYVRFRIDNPTEITGGGTATTTTSSGGTATTSSQTTTGTTDTGQVSGSVGEKDQWSVGGQAGTSTTRSDVTGTSITGNRGGTAQGTSNMRRYRATLVAEVYVAPEFDVSGTDYVNPFKWGMYGTEAALGGFTRVTRSGRVGSVTYYLPAGMAPTPTPAQPNVQRLSASPEESSTSSGPDPLQFSRSGSKPLPQHLAAEAQQHHSRDLSRVRLIQGGQADAYCASMDAAAFTTPGLEGGSDIFVPSNLSPDSPEGFYTLQHEVAHAVQNMEGQTDELEGLGGSVSVRQGLEELADRSADQISVRRR